MMVCLPVLEPGPPRLGIAGHRWASLGIADQLELACGEDDAGVGYIQDGVAGLWGAVEELRGLRGGDLWGMGAIGSITTSCSHPLADSMDCA